MLVLLVLAVGEGRRSYSLHEVTVAKQKMGDDIVRKVTIYKYLQDGQHQSCILCASSWDFFIGDGCIGPIP